MKPRTQPCATLRPIGFQTFVKNNHTQQHLATRCFDGRHSNFAALPSICGIIPGGAVVLFRAVNLGREDASGGRVRRSVSEGGTIAAWASCQTECQSWVNGSKSSAIAWRGSQSVTRPNRLPSGHPSTASVGQHPPAPIARLCRNYRCPDPGPCRCQWP